MNQSERNEKAYLAAVDAVCSASTEEILGRWKPDFGGQRAEIIQQLQSNDTATVAQGREAFFDMILPDVQKTINAGLSTIDAEIAKDYGKESFTQALVKHGLRAAKQVLEPEAGTHLATQLARETNQRPITK